MCYISTLRNDHLTFFYYRGLVWVCLALERLTWKFTIRCKTRCTSSNVFTFWIFNVTLSWMQIWKLNTKFDKINIFGFHSYISDGVTAMLFNHGRLGLGKWFHHTLKNRRNYSSLGLKLIHVSKRGSRQHGFHHLNYSKCRRPYARDVNYKCNWEKATHKTGE